MALSDPKTMVLDIESGDEIPRGTDLDAGAVKFNLERSRQDERSNIKADLSRVASVDVTGPLQVTLRLKNPDTALPAILSDRAGTMASPANLKTLGDRNQPQAGRRRAAEIRQLADNEGRGDAQRQLLVPRAAVSRRHRIRDHSGRATALRSVTSGEKDMAFSLPARLKLIIDRAKQLRTVAAPTLYCVQLYFNYARRAARQCQDPPGDQLRA